MAQQHTEGAWEITEPKHPDPRQIEDRLIFATAKGERLHVAEVYQYQNDNNREANGTALANARLIAASPMLAEFVGRVIRWIPGDGIEALHKEAKELYQLATAKSRPNES